MIDFIKKLISVCFDRQPKFYKIPFGPIRGMRLFTSFHISPRMLFGFDETWVAEIAKQHLKKGDTVYDVGAHIGYTSLVFAELVGNSGRVHAFELLSNVANEYLARTIKANNLEKVIIPHPVGLSNKQEELDIYVGDTMMGTLDIKGYETSHIEHCRTETLDQYIIDSELAIPQLIKVDIERAELQFLEGALSVIEKYKPILIIEFHSIELLKRGFELLNKIGYKLTTKDGELTREIISNISSFHANTLAISNSSNSQRSSSNCYFL